jgi:hypothetical protein
VAAIEFVRDAFGYLKAIGVDAGGRALLEAARVPGDAAVVDVGEPKRFLSSAKTRAWDREASVRTHRLMRGPCPGPSVSARRVGETCSQAWHLLHVAQVSLRLKAGT